MSTLKLPTPALPPGSTVLVTGINGLIASHIASQLLASGYLVRGTVRSLARSSSIRTVLLARHPTLPTDPANSPLTLVQVPDFLAPGAFAAAVKGCAGVVHVATSSDLSPDILADPRGAIDKHVRSVLGMLEDCARDGGVRRVVCTSSAWAAAAPKPGVQGIALQEWTWNEEVVRAADEVARAAEKAGATGVGKGELGVGDPGAAMMSVFMAGKTVAEQKAWEFVRAEKPGFVFNAVLPDTVFGEIMEPEKGGASTAGFAKMCFYGQNQDFLKIVQPQWFVDVVDNARLHIAALVDPGVKGERLYGYAAQWTWDDVLAVYRRLYPERTFMADFMGPDRDLSKVPNERAEGLLKSVFGQDGWTKLEDSLKSNVESFLKVEG